jgi:hypothetical protein
VCPAVRGRPADHRGRRPWSVRTGAGRHEQQRPVTRVQRVRSEGTNFGYLQLAAVHFDRYDDIDATGHRPAAGDDQDVYADHQYDNANHGHNDGASDDNPNHALLRSSLVSWLDHAVM